MKTRISRYMALIALVLGLSSCANEFDKSVDVAKLDTHGYKVILSVITDNQTKSVKSAWEKGDCIYMTFAEHIATKSSFADLSKAVYNGNDWTFERIPDVDASLPISGAVRAFHFQKVINYVDASIERAGEILFTDKGSYEIDPSTKTIYVMLNMNQRPEGVAQISIADVSLEKSGITVSIDGMKSISGIVTFENVQNAWKNGKSFSEALVAEEGTLNGFYNKDTKEYIVFPVASGSKSTSVVVNDGYDVYHRTYKKTLEGRQAIKVGGPFGEEAANWAKYFFVDGEGNVLETECNVSGTEKSEIALCKNSKETFVTEGLEATSEAPGLFSVEVVDGKVVITPILEGNGSLVVSYKGGGFSINRTFNIKVDKNINLRYGSGVSVGDTATMPVAINEDGYVKVYVNDADTPISDYSKVTVKSSSESVAKATVKGDYIEIAPKAYGTATITVASEFDGKKYNNTFVVNVLHNYRLLDASNVAATGELSLIMNGAAAEYYLYDGATKMISYDLDIEGEGEIVTVSKSSAGKISIATSKIGETVLKLSYDTFSHSFAVTVSARQYTMKNIADASVVTSESTIPLWKGKSVSLRAYDGSTEIKTKKYTGSAEDEGVAAVDASGDCVKITGQAAGSVYVNAAYADEAGSIKVKVKVNVFGEPVIATHPDKEVTASENGTATLAVIASGEELSYQWQKATSSGTFSNILGATEKSYSFAVPMSVNGNRYRCVVSNPAGSTTSKEAVIKVVAGLPKITKQPESELKVVGGSASSTVEVSVQATSSVTMNYQWVWSLDNTTWYVYSDKTAATITTTGNWLTDALNNGYVLLRCKITNTSGETSPVYSSIAQLWFIKKPTIKTQPKNVTITEGGSYPVFTVEANANHGTLTYQWEHKKPSETTWTEGIGGGNKTSQYTIGFNNYDSNGRQVRCKVSNEAGSIYTDEATMTVTPKAPVISSITPAASRVVSGSSSSKTNITVTATSSVPMTYNWQYSLDNAVWNNSLQTGSVYEAAGNWDNRYTTQGYVYIRAKVSNSGGVTCSSPVVLYFQKVPTVTLNNGGSTITVDEGGTLSIPYKINFNHATPGSAVMEYKMSGSSTWTQTISSRDYSSYIDNEYSGTWRIENMTYSNNGRKQIMRASNIIGVSAYSNELTIRVKPNAPAVYLPSYYVTRGASGPSLLPYIRGNGTMSYQWQHDNKNNTWINQSSGTSQTFKPGEGFDGYKLRLRVTPDGYSDRIGTSNSVSVIKTTNTGYLRQEGKAHNVNLTMGYNSTVYLWFYQGSASSSSYVSFSSASDGKSDIFIMDDDHGSYSTDGTYQNNAISVTPVTLGGGKYHGFEIKTKGIALNDVELYLTVYNSAKTWGTTERIILNVP